MVRPLATFAYLLCGTALGSCADSQLCASAAECGDCAMCVEGSCVAFETETCPAGGEQPPPAPPADALQVPYGQADPDGNVREWKGLARVPVSLLVRGEISSAEDFAAEFSLQWHHAGLSVLIEVTDDELVPPDSGEIYEFDDSSAVFVDMDPQTSLTGAASWRFDEGEGAVFLLQDGSVVDRYRRGWSGTATFIADEGSWRVEALLRWPGDLAPPAGSVLGFDLGVSDDDNADKEEKAKDGKTYVVTRLFWHDPEDMSLSRRTPKRFAKVVLMAPPSGDQP